LSSRGRIEIENEPIPGSYLIPKSMCSWTPNPKFPVCERGEEEREKGRREGQLRLFLSFVSVQGPSFLPRALFLPVLLHPAFHPFIQSAPLPYCSQSNPPFQTSANKQARTHLREVPLPELVLLDLESSLEDLLSLRSSDGNVASDLLVPSDTEVSNGVSSLGGDGRLSGQLLEDLGRSGKSITRLSDGDVCLGEEEGVGEGEG